MIRVLVNDEVRRIHEGSIGITNHCNEPSVADFTVVDEDFPREEFKRGMRVEITDDSDMLFSGYISEATYRDLNNVRMHSIQCTDLHYVADKRVMARVYTDTNVADIVRAIVDDYLSEEGVKYTVDSINIEYDIEVISFNYVTVSEALDQLAELSRAYWYIELDEEADGDDNKILHFTDALNQEAGNLEDLVGDIQYGTLNIKSSRQDYRNKQYIKGGKGLTDDLVATIIPANYLPEGGEDIYHTVGYKLYSKPEVYVTDLGRNLTEDEIQPKGAVVDEDTVPLVSYEIGSEVIIIEAALLELIENKDLPIEITYQGVYNVTVVVEDGTEIGHNEGIEQDTSGIVENVYVEPSVVGIRNIFQLANAKLSIYSKDNLEIDFETDECDLKVGDLVEVDIARLTNKDGEDKRMMLVQGIEIRDELDILWHSVNLVFGMAHQSWVKVLERGLKGYIKRDDDDGVTNEIIQDRLEYVVDVNETDPINPFRYIVCDTGSNAWICGEAGFYVNFEEGDICTHLEVEDDTGEILIRRERANISDEVPNEIIVTFSIGNEEALGWWEIINFYGGASATDFEGTGIIVEEGEAGFNKTDLEGYFITLRFRKREW